MPLFPMMTEITGRQAAGHASTASNKKANAMKWSRLGIVSTLLCWLSFSSLAGQPSVHKGGYNDVVFFKGRSIAVGTDGRIDCISPSGEKTRIDSSSGCDLRSAFANGEILLAAGDSGTILFSPDGRTFYRATSGTERNINGIASKDGLLIAGADNGMILASTNGRSWDSMSLPIRGNIVSISANPSFFIGVSDSGEIIRSEEGRKWAVQDFNKEYHQHTTFKKITASRYSVVIIGTHEDGSPSILTSSLGNVWSERPPIYEDELGVVRSLTVAPNGITYDPDRDQFILACDHGELVTLPPCSKCNKYARIGGNDLHALIYADSTLVIVGDEFSTFTQKLQ